jgi:CarD family transcriptional regulator
MTYQVGDTVIHWNYGRGEIIGVEEKYLAGQKHRYYVVKTPQLTLWVPTDQEGESSLRPPTTRTEFKARMKILRGDGEALPEDQYQRQNQLVERMRKRTLDDLCHIVRDLTTRSRSQRLNRSDIAIVKRAEELLLDEWQLSLGVTRDKAQLELLDLLK